MKYIYNFIDNKSIHSDTTHQEDVFNPATGEVIAQVSFATEAICNDAINSSKKALKEWSRVTPLIRSRILFKFKTLLENHRDELACLITEQHGKVFSDAHGEITRGLEVVEFACGIPHLLKGDHSLNVGRGVDSYSLMQPVGVCVGITPFNFPFMVPMWMLPIAIACGNTFILKPSEKNPEPALFLVDLLKQAGLPDGVVNVIHGGKEVVDTLLESNDVDAVSFVGSTPIAEYIYTKASSNNKRCQALGGAKNHMVIMPDADFELATSSLMGAAYGSAGERCMAISVAVCVGDQTADKMLVHLKNSIDDLKVGNGMDKNPEPDMGPVISKAHLDKITSYIESGVNEGATLVVDGRKNSFEKGYFIGASLFDHVTKKMKIYKEEIFGPVLVVVRVDTLSDALDLINEHEYGNGTAIFTQNGRAARIFQEEVKVGMVGINVPIPVPMSFHSFGGWKRSIFGPLNMHGTDGVRFYTKMKTITSRWPEADNNQAEYSMPTLD